ncbi:MAG: efflux RND transporter periplasmic adaptor subunit [Bacteroidales bacterium]
MKIFNHLWLKGLLLTSMILMVLLLSCGRKQKVPLPPAKVQVIGVLQTNVPVPADYVGQTYGYKDIPIRARVDGFLTGMYFREGSNVKKGQLLYTIDPEPLKAIEADKLSGLTEAQTHLARAESDLRRIRPLAAINAVSQRDLDAAVAEYEAATARVEAHEAQVRYAQINLGYTRVTSPIDGIIGKTEAKTGEYVGKAPNPVVLNEVSSTDTILVNFSISESEFIKLARTVIERAKAGKGPQTSQQESEAKVSLILSDGSLFDFPGRLSFADRQVDPTTGTILIQAAFPNPDRLLRPGQFARVRVTMEEIENGLLVPQRCVRELQGVFQVYVLTADNTIETRNVKMGPKVGGMWLVEAGLKPGETIVFEGLNLVRPGMKVDPVMVDIPPELMNY